MSIDPALMAAAQAQVSGNGQPAVGGAQQSAPPTMVAPPNQNPYQQPNQVPPQLPPELMPNAWDNHEAHIFYHNQYRKSQEFEMLPDHVKQIFEIHVNMHQQALTMGVQPAGGGPVIGGQQNVMDPSQQVSDGSQNPQAQQGAY